jgi:hypothetical protein
MSSQLFSKVLGSSRLSATNQNENFPSTFKARRIFFLCRNARISIQFQKQVTGGVPAKNGTNAKNVEKLSRNVFRRLKISLKVNDSFVKGDQL